MLIGLTLNAASLLHKCEIYNEMDTKQVFSILLLYLTIFQVNCLDDNKARSVQDPEADQADPVHHDLLAAQHVGEAEEAGSENPQR